MSLTHEKLYILPLLCSYHDFCMAFCLPIYLFLSIEFNIFTRSYQILWWLWVPQNVIVDTIIEIMIESLSNLILAISLMEPVFMI